MNDWFGMMPKAAAQMTLRTLCPSHIGSANGNKSSANTAKGDLLAKVCSNKKHATGGDKETAAELRSL